MSPLPDEIIKELQRDYIATFSEKLEIIEKAFASKDWPTLTQAFHKLAGSGATYSMPEISELSRGIELYLNQHANPPEPIVFESIIVLKKIFSSRTTGKPYEIKNEPLLKKIKTV